MRNNIIKITIIRLIILIIFVLASCSVEMDSDLETGLDKGYISDTYEGLQDIMSNDNSTNAAYSSTTTTYLYHFEDGVVPSNFSMSGNANWSVTSST